jgi:hypothetical protein
MPHGRAWADIERENALASKLDQLRAMTTIVADTGDLGAVARLKPVDCTTNPTIVLKAIDTPEYRDVVDEALAWGRKQSGDDARLAAATADRLAVSVGVELLRLVPGYVSTEVDANLSFNIRASVARARQIDDAYQAARCRTRARAHQTRIDVGGDTRRTDPPTRGCEVQHDVVAEPGAGDRQR